MIKNLNTSFTPQKISEQREVKLTTEKSVENGFNRVLDQVAKESAIDLKNIEGVSFSKHALERLKDRQIPMDSSQMKRLGGAIDKAAKKGSMESLIISDNAAFIVNVPKRKIITAMDRAQMQENVFTNIDSTVIA